MKASTDLLHVFAHTCHWQRECLHELHSACRPTMRQIQTKCLACRKAADSILDMPQPLFTFPVKLAGYRRFLWVYSFCSCGKSEKRAIFLQISQHNDKPANIVCNRSSCQLHSACEILLLLHSAKTACSQEVPSQNRKRLHVSSTCNLLQEQYLDASRLYRHTFGAEQE